MLGEDVTCTRRLKTSMQLNNVVKVKSKKTRITGKSMYFIHTNKRDESEEN